MLYAFPAPAGMNRAAERWNSCDLSVPRPRGDEPNFIGIVDGTDVRSPPPRG